MAKQQKFTLDDFSFDKNLDVPDFDFDIKPPKDTRKPIMKVASGLKTGFSAVALSNDFARDMVKKALPKGFGSAYDIAEKSASNLKSLYDDTAREIRPFMNDLKRTTARLLPKVEEAMPKKVAQMVKDWTATADANPSSPNYDPREAEISAQLAGMIKATALLQQKQSEDTDQKDRLREGLEQVRHRDKLKQLDQMRLGILQLADYQANVTSNYHRKSLELQYRHYFVAVDALEESKRANAEMKAALAAIVHNTALPEQVKLHASDAFKTMAKKQIGSVIGNTIFGRSNDFLNTLMGNLKKTAVGRVKNTIGLARGGLQDVNAGLDDMDLAEAMGMKTDPHHAGGVAAGAFGTSILGDWLAGKLKPHLDKIPGIKKAGNKLQYGAENLPQILDQWARSNKGENGGLSDGLIRFLKANVRSASKLQTGVQKDTVQGMNEPSYFSRQSSKTLNEIIPGYLARMLRELQIIRTGDQKTEMVHYDFTKNRFDTHSNVKKNAFGSLVNKDQRDWTKEQVEKLIDEVDGKKTLSPEQRKALGQQLLRNNVRGRLGGVEVLGKTQRYDGDAQQHASQFSQLFRDYFKNDHDSSKKHSFANAYNSLGQFASASRDSVQDFSNLGMNDFLQESGILNEKGDAVDLEKFFEYYYGSEYNPAGNPAAPGHHTFTGQPMGPKGSRRRGPRRSAARPPKQPFMGGKSGQGGVGDSLNAKMLSAIHVDTMHIDRNTMHISDMMFSPEQKPSVFSKMLDKLNEMAERMEKGLPTMVVGNVADGNIPAAAVDNGKKGKGWWWNRSIKDAAKGIGGGLWGAARGAGKFSNWLVGGGIRSSFGVARFGAGLIGGQLGRAADKMRGFKDVYSESTGRKVLLYGQRLKAGEYFDVKTGKPIKTWKDIQGAVADESGIVMTEEQAATAYVREGMGKKLIRGLGAIVKTGAKIGNAIGGSVFNALPRGWKLVSGAGGMVLKAASSYMNGPQDVYVHDANNPKKLRKALDAKTMRAGGYKSSVSDHPIKNPKDIDGAVVNYKGVEVLTDDEFKMGLYNKNGDPIKTGISRLLGGVGKIAGAGVGALKWLAGGINQGIGHAFGLGKGFLSGLSGIFGRGGIFFGGGRKLMDTVGEIRDLLKERLPKPHKIRKGSIEDQHRARKEAEDEARKGGKDGDQDGKKRGGILGLLSGLFGRKKKKDDEEGDGKGGIVDDVESGLGQAIGGSILGKIPGGKYLRKIPGLGRLFGKGAAGAAEGAVAGAAKRGIGSRMLGGLKWGKGLGAGLALGAAGSLANATGHTTIGKGLDYAGDAATGWSAASGLAGLLGVEGGALGLAGAAGGALLSGLGAIIASPVLLPALGVAAAGAALYGGYKFLTRNKLDDLSKVRYAQYGWKAEDSDYVSKVFGLENSLMPGVIYQGGMAQIDPKKVDLKKTAESFGVDLKDREQVTAFATWYLNRFKPVFITHLTILNGIKPGVALSDVGGKLNAQEKQKYLSGIQMPSDPYNVMVSPIPGAKLSAGPDDVKAAIDDAKKSIDKNAKDDKDKKPTDALNKASQATGPKLAAASGAAAVGAAAGAAVDAINKQATANQPQLPKTGGGTGAALGASVGAAITAMNNAQVGAMEAIRFKTYGLKEMDTDKVHSLRQLETLVQKDVKVSKGKADWNGDVSDLTAKIAPQFGFSGNRSNRAYDWMAWFHKRFLPTYLTYVSSVCSVTNQQDPTSAMKAIKPDDLLNAAKQVVSASTAAYGMTTSVWQIPTSPWENYELNKESASTDGNMASLKQAQKAPALPEQAAFQKKTSAANDSKNTSQDNQPSAAPSWLDKLKSGVSNAWDATKAFAGKAWDATKSAGAAVGNAVVSAGTAVGNFASNVASGAGDALKSGYDTAKKTAARGVASVSAALKGGMNTLASLISRGEGNYSIANKPSGNSYPVAKGVDVSKMTIGQIQQAQAQRQLFAVGRYQLIPSTLAGAVKQLGLSADTVFSPALQDKIFSEFLVGAKRPKIAAYLSGKTDDVAGAALAAAQEWASIGTPKGMKNAHGQVSDGTTSYYAGIGGNKASISADEIMGALQAARKDGSSKQTVNVANAPAGGAGAGTPDKSGGAATTTASTAGAAGGSGGGIMKVADQTPGPAPATKGTTTTPADASTSSASGSGYPAAASDTSGASSAPVTGFQNRSKDLAAQGDYQNENLAKSLGPVTDVLKQSLTVQQGMLEALKQLVQMGGGQPGKPGKTPAPTGGSASPDAMQRKSPQSMPTPPVSMSKMV
jgi:muramidase (phage lysozyme)